MCFFIGVSEIRSLRGKSISLWIEDESYVSAEVVGEVILLFYNFRKIVLKDVFYIPHFKRNLIFIACVFNGGYSVTFNKVIVIHKNHSLICNG